MALQKQVIEIPFGQGIESKHSKYSVPVDKLKRCHNGRWVETNRLEKRPPYISIGRALYPAPDGTAGTMSGVTQLGECRSQILAVDGGMLCASVDGGLWRQVNRLPSAYCTRSVLYRAGKSRNDAQSATALGLTATVFSGEDVDLRAIVYDSSSGEIAVAEKTLTAHSGSSTVFRVLAVGSWIAVIYIVPTTGAIKARCLNAAAPSLGWAPAEVVTAAHVIDTTNPAIDAQAVGGSASDIWFAYNESVAGLIVQRYRRDHTAATWSTINTSAAVGEVSEVATTVCEGGDGMSVLVAWIGSAAGHHPRSTQLTSGLVVNFAAADLNADDASWCNIITAVARPGVAQTWAVLYDNGIGLEYSA